MIPNLRSKSAKKRKGDDVIDLVDPAFDIVKAAEQIIRCYQEKVETIDDIQKLSDLRIAAHEKDTAELVKLRKEIKDFKSSITKKFAEPDAKVVEMKKVLVDEVKKDAAIAIMEARVQMASEIAAKGVDTSLWTIAKWKTKLAELKGEDPDAITSLEVTTSKAPKASPDKTQKAVVEVGDAEMNDLASVTEVLRELASAETEGPTPGKDGI